MEENSNQTIAGKEKKVPPPLASENDDHKIVSSDDFGQELENDISFVFDLPLEVSGELGRLVLTIRELLSLQVGSILELEKLAGEPLEILINNKMVCKGEVIVINEKYGIRMTDLISPDENLEVKKASQG